MADAAAAPDRTRPPFDRAWLAITACVVAACNWAFSGDRYVFHLLADEPGTLGMARWLAGRNRWNLFDHSTWQPGLALLVTPIHVVTSDPEVIVRYAIAVNSVIAGCAAAVTAVLARRLADLPDRSCALLAIVVATTPGALSGAGYIWAEPLVTLTFTGALLCTIRTADRAPARWAHGAVAIAAAGYLSHARLLPFVAVTTTTIVAIALLQSRRRLALTSVGVGVAAFVVARAISTIVHLNVWDEPGRVNTSGSVLSRLKRPLDVVDLLVGQLWYQLAVTLGVGAVGVVVVLRTLATGDRKGLLDRRAAMVIVALTTPQIAVSAVFLVGRGRADQLVYGRYNEAVMWPVLVVGLCWFVRLAQRGWNRRVDVDVALAVLAMMAFTVATQWRSGDVLRDDIGLRSMVPGILAFVGRADEVPVVRIGLIAMGAFAFACIAAIGLRARLPHALSVASVATVAGLLVLGAVRTHDGEARLLNGWKAVAAIRDIDTIVPADATIGVKMVRDSEEPSLTWTRQRHRYQVVQLYLPHRSFVRDRGIADGVGPYVLAPTGDPDLIAAEAEILWNDPSANMTLYRERP